jgi:hypothetical protein
VRDDIIVTVNSNRRSLNEVITDLQKLGFEVKDVLSNIDCVFGAIDRNRINTAKNIKGISYIEFNKAQGRIDEE